MSTPWILAARPFAATRWLDTSGAALRAHTVTGVAAVSGSLDRQQPLQLGPIFGQASVVGTLRVAQRMDAASSGSASATATLGWAQPAAGVSSGAATASGDLIQGEGYGVAGSSQGVAAARASLTVRLGTHIGGGQEGDDWGTGEGLPVGGSGRDDGPTRRRFTPRSIGLTNERHAWNRTGLTSTGSTLGSE